MSFLNDITGKSKRCSIPSLDADIQIVGYRRDTDDLARTRFCELNLSFLIDVADQRHDAVSSKHGNV